MSQPTQAGAAADAAAGSSSPPQQHHSALFAALSRRSGSVAGTGDGAKATATREAQMTANKLVRRHVLEQVRNDWSYEPNNEQSPSASDPAETAAAASAAAQPDTSVAASQADLNLDVTEWRPREVEDTSCSEPEEASGTTTSSAAATDPETVEQNMLERRRKRRRLLEDEMQWNEGLRMFNARRDAWTGARRPASAKQGVKSAPLASVLAGGAAAATAAPRDQDGDVEMAKNETQEPEPNACKTDTASSSLSSHLSEETLVPVVQANALYGEKGRAPIRPSSYSTIYSRLVVQANTPAVPLNLKHVVRALVFGWKQNGEWPPRPTPNRIDVPVLKRRSGMIAARPEIAHTTSTTTVEPDPEEKRRRGSLGGAVKKVFNLSGRFHLRNNSRDIKNSKQKTPPTVEQA